MRLGEILIRAGAATAEQVEAALAEPDETLPRSRLGSILVERGVVSEEQVALALAEQFGLATYTVVDDSVLDPGLVDRLSVDWARTHCILPVRTSDGMCVLTADPAQVEAQDDLALILGAELTPLVSTRTAILDAIERCYYQRQDSPRDFLLRIESGSSEAAPAAESGNDLLRVSGEAPVSQLVNLILLEALKANASDIHIEPLQDELKIRYRIDGLLYGQASPPKHLESSLVSRLKVMGRLDIAEKRLPQDGMARVRVGEREIDVRISTVPVPEGERMVLRLLNRSDALFPLTDLGMPPRILDAFRRVLRSTEGIVLITGPTGSGKTTTLYAALQELDTEHRNILTVEDPVEYQLPNIGQIQVKPKIGLTFAHGLRHILRQDPDIILVGETRDLETADVMIRASLTGHLVFTTLHTNDAISAVVRLIDMGIEPYLLSASLRASLAQRLVRKLCPLCCETAQLTRDERQRLGRHADRLEGSTLKRRRGCDECVGGYRGRTGLYELLVATDPFLELVRESRGLSELREQASKDGMPTLLEAGLDAVAAGITSVEEVLRAAGASAETPS